MPPSGSLLWRRAERVDLQSDIAGSTNEGRAPRANPSQRLDPGHVRGHQVRQINFQDRTLRTGDAHFRNVGYAEPTGNADNSPFSLSCDADPTLHIYADRKKRALRL